MTKEDKIPELDKFGLFQKRICVLLSLCTIPNGLITLIMVFLQYTPPHHCNIATPRNDTTNLTSVYYEHLLNTSIPFESNSFGIISRSQCFRYAESNKNYSDSVHNETTECDKGWTFDTLNGITSTVTEWQLVCSRSWIKPVVSSVYLGGILMGSLVSGFISDRYGRRPVFLWGTLGQFLFLFLSGFSNTVEMFVCCMFGVGFSGLLNYQAGIVLGSEIMNPKHRALSGTVINIAYSVGYMMLPGISYLIPDWRWLARTIGLLGFFYIPCYWLLPESPRWLIKAGKEKEAKILMKKISDINRPNLQTTKSEANEMFPKPSEELSEIKSTTPLDYLRMLRNHELRKRTILIFLSWFCIGAMYYCIGLNTDHLGENIYIYCFISAAVEFPAYLVSFFMMNCIGRTLSMFSCMTFGGMAYGLVVLFNEVHPTIGIVLAMISKFLITAAFNLIYIQTCELYPTMLRHTNLGMASTACRVGSIIVPYIIYAGMQLHYSIPYISMGILCVGTGITCLMLPETKGEPIPQTVADAANLNRFVCSCCQRNGEYSEDRSLPTSFNVTVS